MGPGAVGEGSAARKITQTNDLSPVRARVLAQEPSVCLFCKSLGSSREKSQGKAQSRKAEARLPAQPRHPGLLRWTRGMQVEVEIPCRRR